MSEHTKGPWQRLGHTFIGTVEDDPQVIAHTSNHRNRKARPVHEAEANARLIAAAPDLLAALEEGRNLFCHDNPCDLSISEFMTASAAWCERVEAVIARAKGESDE